MAGPDKEPWQVKLDGHPHDRDDVAELLTPLGYSLVQRDDGDWYLSGGEIDRSDDANEALHAAKDVLRKSNAVLKARNRKFRPVRVASSVRKGDSCHVFIQPASVELRVKVSGSLQVHNPGSDNPAVKPAPPMERERRWLQAAEHDPHVRGALDLLVGDKDNKYYRILEYLARPMGGSKDEIRKFMHWPKKRFSKLTATLDALRHEHPNNRPTMPISEAERMVEEFLRKWLDFRSDANRR